MTRTEQLARVIYERHGKSTPWDKLHDQHKTLWLGDATAALTAIDEERDALRAERDALLEKPVNLAKMDSIDDDATDRMIAYYWREQANEARTERDALREALRPFAVIGNHCEGEPDETVLYVHQGLMGDYPLTIGDFRKARSLSSVSREEN